MTRADLTAYLAQGRAVLKVGFKDWAKRPSFTAVAVPATIALASLATALEPPENIDPADWTQKYRYVSADSGSPYPGKWDHIRSPQVIEPLRSLSADDPCMGVVLKWSAQTSKSEVGVNWFGYVGHIEKLPMMITQSGIVELGKFNRYKIQPTIDSTPVLKKCIEGESDKSGKGSTTFIKAYPGGGCILASAGSSSALQGVTRARYWGDEVSEYPAETGHRGDPVQQAIKRMEVYRNSKYLLTSTCQIKNSCRISLAFDQSDQRKWYVPCPHCGDFHTLELDNLHWSTNHNEMRVPVFSCPSCGTDIAEREKDAMVDAAIWVPCFKSKNATNPQPPEVISPENIETWAARDCEGIRTKGYHLWKAYAKTSDWDGILLEYEEAEGDSEAMKVFWQQVLAEPWDDSGEAPDHVDLAKRTESYPDCEIPLGAYFTTGAADVQKDRIEWGVYAWGPNLHGWLIDKGIFKGATDQPEVWREFIEFTQTAAYPYQNGLTFPVDLWGVDSGYRSPIVYQATRGLANVYNLDGRGRDKPSAPPLSSPKSIQHKIGGTVVGRTTKYDVGTYGLKTRMYGMLRQWQDGPNDEGEWPKGVVHFPKIADEEFFEQVTAEVLVPHARRGGRIDYYWQKIKNRPNEHHDILIYNLALACHLRWDTKKPEQWHDLIEERGVNPEAEQATLEDLWGPTKIATPKGVTESEVMPRSSPRAKLLAQLAALNNSPIDGDDA